jgi:type VI secretion system secreted protein VgrG
MGLSQKDRMIRITTPLGENTFVVLSFSGFEEISDLFGFELQLASERNDITFNQLAGKNVTISIRAWDGTERLFNGIIVEFEPSQIASEDGYSRYTAVMVPNLWMLTGCIDSRIFQQKSVPEIIQAVLSEASLGPKGVKQAIEFRMELIGNYSKKEYCVQYNESDFAFISRLCETEGIFYFFEHKEKNHTLVFADHANHHKPYAAGSKQIVSIQNALGGVIDREVIFSLRAGSKITTGKYVARDYNFTIPNDELKVENCATTTDFNGPGEHYEYPGGYEQTNARGQTLARLRKQAMDARFLSLRGRGNCTQFIPGFKFGLKDHAIEQLNGREYVLLRVRHEARQPFAAGDSKDSNYFNLFSCLPTKIPYRPERSTPKPVIASSQTAIVTGPAGEEIHTNKYGQVKVRFPWDRNPEKNSPDNMSCWIRVSQGWAGDKWGAMHIPRVGQEVIINFLEGDPDRPIITGRVYHGNNLPPYTLPAEKTKSTLKSDSSKGGGNHNEIMFEDLSGNELFFTHAAKDRSEVVQNDKATEVKNNQQITVKNNRSISITSGNETVSVQSGSRQVAVKSNETHTNSAHFDHRVDGNYALKVSGSITIEASGIVRITGAKVILN